MQAHVRVNTHRNIRTGKMTSTTSPAGKSRLVKPAIARLTAHTNKAGTTTGGSFGRTTTTTTVTNRVGPRSKLPSAIVAKRL